ncbi:retrovirus-related pol polyprotein from transposon TNT 1-94 [Tanacetum coccineum]
MGIARFRNDHFTAITGYRDYVQGNLTICHVYYVEGIGHNLFSVGQFCDGDLGVYFLRTKDEAPDMIINFINQVQRSLKAQILKIQTNNGTEFKNEKLRLFYAKLGIVHHTSINRMPQQNGVNHSVIHTQYNKTLYELIRGRKPNVQYFHVFGSLCYLIHDCDDLGKMKPKADIGIFIGYSESSKGPILKYSNFHDSSDDMNEIPSQQDLDHLFGPLYEEYYMSCTSDVTNDSAANTLDVKDTLSPSLIIVEDSDAPQIVTSSEEPIIQESSIPVLETHSDEQLQEDVAELDGNTIMHSF